MQIDFLSAAMEAWILTIILVELLTEISCIQYPTQTLVIHQDMDMLEIKHLSSALTVNYLL